MRDEVYRWFGDEAYETFAEANMADNAEAAAASEKPGWIQTAYDGLAMSLELINEKRIKVIVNGGCLDPRGLAKEVEKMARLPRPSPDLC